MLPCELVVFRKTGGFLADLRSGGGFERTEDGKAGLDGGGGGGRKSGEAERRGGEAEDGGDCHGEDCWICVGN